MRTRGLAWACGGALAIVVGALLSRAIPDSAHEEPPVQPPAFDSPFDTDRDDNSLDSPTRAGESDRTPKPSANTRLKVVHTKVPDFRRGYKADLIVTVIGAPSDATLYVDGVRQETLGLERPLRIVRAFLSRGTKFIALSIVSSANRVLCQEEVMVTIAPSPLGEAALQDLLRRVVDAGPKNVDKRTTVLLRLYGGPAVQAALVKIATTNRDVEVRRWAIFGLGELQAVDTLPDLVQLLSNSELRRHASRALRQITGHSFPHHRGLKRGFGVVERQEQWTEWLERNIDDLRSRLMHDN